MSVTCKICKAKIDKETAYMVMSGIKTPVRNYYCSKSEYDNYKNELKAKDSVYEEVVSIFGYRIKNTLFFSEEKEWSSLKPYSIILKYLQSNHDYLTQRMNSVGGKEDRRIKYFSAILKNSLYDYEPVADVAPAKVIIDETMYEVPQHYTANRKRSLADLEDEI